MKFSAALLAIFLLLTLSCGLASAQTLVRDTLLPAGMQTGDAYCDAQVINCLRPDCRKGYVTGNNRLGLREVLLKFRHPWPGRVRGCFINLGRKKMASAASLTSAVVYAVGPDGYPDTSARTLSEPVPMGQIQDGAYRRFNFDTAGVAYADSFFIGLVLPATPGDTLGVFQTKNRASSPCAAPADTLAYERWDDGSFTRAYDTWETVFELGIKVDVEFLFISVRRDLERLVQVSPVPATRQVAVSLPQAAGGLTGWQLLAPDGRLARQGSGGHPGQDLRIARGGLPAGVYVLRLHSGQGTLSRRVVFAD